jgi:hypothetical protein
MVFEPLFFDKVFDHGFKHSIPSKKMAEYYNPHYIRTKDYFLLSWKGCSPTYD